MATPVRYTPYKLRTPIELVLDAREVELDWAEVTRVEVGATTEVRVYETGDARNSRAPVHLIRIRTDDWPERERVAQPGA